MKLGKEVVTLNFHSQKCFLMLKKSYCCIEPKQFFSRRKNFSFVGIRFFSCTKKIFLDAWKKKSCEKKKNALSLNQEKFSRHQNKSFLSREEIWRNVFFLRRFTRFPPRLWFELKTVPGIRFAEQTIFTCEIFSSREQQVGGPSVSPQNKTPPQVHSQQKPNLFQNGDAATKANTKIATKASCHLVYVEKYTPRDTLGMLILKRMNMKTSSADLVKPTSTRKNRKGS